MCRREKEEIPDVEQGFVHLPDLQSKMNKDEKKFGHFSTLCP